MREMKSRDADRYSGDVSGKAIQLVSEPVHPGATPLSNGDVHRASPLAEKLAPHRSASLQSRYVKLQTIQSYWSNAGHSTVGGVTQLFPIYSERSNALPMALALATPPPQSLEP